MFRNESEAVIGKIKARQPSKSTSKSPSLTSSTSPASSTSLIINPLERIYRPTLETEVAKHYGYPLEYPGSVTISAMPTTAIPPTLEERAGGYFRTNSPLWLRNYDLVDELCSQTYGDEPLLASINAVGLSSFAHSVQSTEVSNKARMYYVKALQLTNAALRSPTEVRKDSTLLSVMILSIFEMVAGSNEHSLEAWNEHVIGASTLLKLRGPIQLRTKVGQRLFMQVVGNLFISCMQRATAMPEHIVELRNGAAEYMSTTTWPAWRLSEVIIDFINFRAAVRDCDIVGPEAVIRRALEMDCRFLEVFEDVPEEWIFTTKYTDKDQAFVWNKRYDVYRSNWGAQMWNGMRCCRILLHELIRDQLLAASTAMTPIFSEEETVLQTQRSVEAMLQMQADILASIPQHIPSNFNYEPSTLMESSRGHFVLWPLFMVGAMDLTTKPIREWVVKSLALIADQVGFQQANILAEILEQQRHIIAWDTKPAPRLRKKGNIPGSTPTTWQAQPDWLDSDPPLAEGFILKTDEL